MKLSKREIIMLTVLIVIAVFFIEARLIITPAMTRVNEMRSQVDSLQAEYQMINYNLAVAENSKKTRDENLVSIEALSMGFLNGVTPDALLHYTHTMLEKHGFMPYNYGPTPIGALLLQTDQVEVSELNYRLKTIAQEYRRLNPSSPTDDPDPGEGGSGTEPGSANDIVEIFTVKVSATGSYAQVKALLDDYDSLGKQIIFTNFNMSSAQGEAGLLSVSFSINYYGIDKLTPGEDSLNEWVREPLSLW